MNAQSAALNRIAGRRIAVLGDLILDRYTWGDADRVSPEAPVLVLNVERRELRPGGAASVALLARGLGAEVTVFGAVGDDGEGRALRRILVDEGVDCSNVLTDSSRPTTSKERFIGRAAGRHPHQILRVDHEDTTPIEATLQRRMQTALQDGMIAFESILVADYAKGVCTPAVVDAAVHAAARHRIPVIVDPARGADFSHYSDATVVKPNRVELELATGLRIDSPEAAADAARLLCERFDHRSVLVTLDSQGMVLVQPQGTSHHFPTIPRSVYDVTGAGDMVLAVVGLCLAAGVSLDEAAELANVAAGLEVERFGTAPVNLDEIAKVLRGGAVVGGASANKIVELIELVECVEAYRQAGRTVVLTNGCFDLLHAGHLASLEQAATYGDVLIVAVNGDASVRRLKGAARPVIGQRDRAALLGGLDCVDHVLVFDDDTPHRLLRRIRPDVLVKGAPYSPEEVVGREVVLAYGGQVCVTGRVEGVSTSQILTAVRAGRRCSTSGCVHTIDESKGSVSSRQTYAPIQNHEVES